MTVQRQLEIAIQQGYTILLEEVGEQLDPALDSVMNKAVFVEDNVKKIVFGDKKMNYNLSQREAEHYL